MPKKPDPAALLLRTTRSLPIGPVVVTVPYRPAAGWLPALLRDLQYLPTDLAGDVSELLPALLSGEVTAKDVESAVHSLVEEVTGMRWWEAQKLASTSVGTDVLGELTLSGVDPERVTIGQWVSAVYRACTRHADKKEKSKFDFSLSIPPEGYEDAWDDDSDAYYEAMMADAQKMTQA
jgi:hypothetical protein